MAVRLREDNSYSKSLSDYQYVDIDNDNWTQDDEDTLMLIHQTLMGEN